MDKLEVSRCFEKLGIYSKVRETGVHNFEAAKIEVNHAMNNEKWLFYKDNIVNKQVIDYIRYGFPTGHTHKLLPISTEKNHATATNYSAHVDKYIATELSHGSLIGPFQHMPFEWCMVSPLLTRDKSSSSDRRVIMDLSFPPKFSVNSGIPTDEFLGIEFHLKLPSALTLRNEIREAGKGALLWSRDLARSYRQLRTCPLDWPLLGIKWRELYFIDCSVPFGLRTGAKSMQEVSTAVTDILKKEEINCIAYIDDLAGVERKRESAQRGFDRCGSLLMELGLKEATKKATPPATRMIWLGVLFDSVNMTMEIPKSKIEEIQNIVEQWQDRRYCKPTELKSLLGRLFFCSDMFQCSQIILQPHARMFA